MHTQTVTFNLDLEITIVRYDFGAGISRYAATIRLTDDNGYAVTCEGLGNSRSAAIASVLADRILHLAIGIKATQIVEGK